MTSENCSSAEISGSKHNHTVEASGVGEEVVTDGHAAVRGVGQVTGAGVVADLEI